MKCAVIVSLLSMILLPPAVSQAKSHPVLAAAQFYDSQGNLGNIVVLRDPSQNVTQLDYSFCVSVAVASCQRGSGYIPNGAFTGNVSTNGNQGSVLRVLADTSNLPTSFTNFICFQYDPTFGECQGGTGPGAGGLISLSFTKVRDWAITNTLTFKSYVFGRLAASGIDDQSNFAARMQGTVFGLTINTTGIDPYLDWMWTDTNSLNVKQKFLLAKHQQEVKQ
jgi:hypothetical protein